MSLDLDKRQRAMLREMGVRVWQPAAPLAEPVVAIDSVAVNADVERAAADFSDKSPPLARETAAPAPTRPPPASAPAPAAPAPPPEAQAGRGPSWRVGEARALYAGAAPVEGARWLVLAETPAMALRAEPFNPFEGDAGKLLDNMLRAARLHQAGGVLLAPLVRLAAAGAATDLPAALSALLAHARPDVVLVMGRLAAQALLPSGAPFGKLRGQVHRLHGTNTVVTYDAAFLLRSPADKAKAWDDLCLAMSLLPRTA